MSWIHRMLILFVLVYISQDVIGKSCHYDNLHALPDWTRVRSPGYPGRFPAQTQCWWKIKAPPQFRIQLEITDFALVPPNRKDQCVWQWLNIIEGASDEKSGGQPPMLTLCGTNKPRMVISSGNTIRLNLHSNSAAASSPYRGFSAKYKYTSEEPFIPDVSNQLPDMLASGNPGGPSPSMNSRSIGDVINPFIKPKPIVMNPNAVLTMKNRRTEEQNRARNEGRIPTADSAQKRGNSLVGERRPPIEIPTSNRNMPTFKNNIIEKEELPPKRGKPLPREIQILLAVLGTVGAVVLVLYLVKRFAFDKAHRRKNSGKIMHAYAHFRRFKKKKKNAEDGEEGAKVSTVAASVANVNETPRLRDSGHVALKENEGLEKGLAIMSVDRNVSSGKSTTKQKNVVNSRLEKGKTDSPRNRTSMVGAHAPERRPQQNAPAYRPDGDGISTSGYDEEHYHHHHRRRRHETHEFHSPASRHPRQERHSVEHGHTQCPSRDTTSRGTRTQSRAVRHSRHLGLEKGRMYRGTAHGRNANSRRTPST